MAFKERLEDMLRTIRHEEDGKETFRLRHSAEDWSEYDDRIYFNPVLQMLFDKDFEITERKEEEMRLTIHELIWNSFIACREDYDLFIDYIVYFGVRGIVIHIKDDGTGFNHEKEIRERRENTKGLTDDLVLYGRETKGYPGGTGIYCLLHFAQDFQYNGLGNEVIVRFDLSK